MTHTKKGFTLIELLVVIAIIAILSAIGLVALNGAREKARDAQRRSDIAQIRTALSLYYDDNGSSYPNAVGGEGLDTADATDNVRDQSENSQDEGATGYGVNLVFDGNISTCTTGVDDSAYGVLSQCGELTDNYLAQSLGGPTAEGGDADRYFYIDNVASTAATPITNATSYMVYTMLEAAGGENYYGINEQGTVTDIAAGATLAATCDNTANPVCSF